MKTPFKMTLAAFAGVALGAAAIHVLHAQAKPPVYYVAENDMINVEVYTKEFAPKVADTLKPFGGRYIVAGGKTTAVDGAPPKSRIAVIRFESMEQAVAWRKTEAYAAIAPIRNRAAKVRAFFVEGVTD